VTLIDTSIADTAAPVIGSTTIDLRDRQVPIDFQLSIPARDLPARGRYALRAAIRDADGNLLWTTDTGNAIEPGEPSIDAGVLMLTRVRPSDAAGGGGATQAPWTATGNEPGWRLTMADENLTLLWNYGQDTVVLPRPEPGSHPGGRSYASSDASHELRVDVAERTCRDNLTGMPYPEAVTVNIDGNTLSGCGGSPASLLMAGEWLVEDIGGKGIVDRSRATLNFGEDGRVTGRASCNTYGASWNLSGEGLSVEKGQSTLMACSPALDDQERQFLRLLGAVQRFDITDDGALVLHAADGETIVARRE
jgi:heat shock protein HslJ